MGIILQIAIRNLREHKLKSIIICSLIALGMFLLVLGNSIIDTGKAGIEKSFIKSVSGHILVGPTGKDGQKPVIIRNGMGSMMGDKTPSVPQYQDVLATLKEYKGVSAINPQVYGIAQIELNDEYRAFAGCFGVDVQAYQEMFPGNIEILQGQFLTSDQEGIMLSEKVWKDIKNVAGMEIKAGDKLKVMAMGAGTKIIYLPVAGIFRFATSYSTMQELCFMDVSSLRYLQGMVVGAADQIKVSDEDQSLMSISIDDLDSLFTADSSETAEISVAGADAYSDEAMKARFGDTEKRSALNKADSGAWHYLLLRLEDGGKVDETIASLNTLFKEKGWSIEAVNWETAAGAIASFVTAAQWFFLIMVILLSVVSVIVIMNTLVVSIVERTAEIGTMRALGAQKAYIRLIFTSETLALSIVGGLVGLIAASVLLFILNLTGLPAPNELFEMVFGGKVLHPVLSVWSAIQAMCVMLIVGLFSSIYPTYLALKIQPVQAMQSN